jgi:hypothetical protein
MLNWVRLVKLIFLNHVKEFLAVDWVGLDKAPRNHNEKKDILSNGGRV